MKMKAGQGMLKIKIGSINNRKYLLKKSDWNKKVL